MKRSMELIESLNASSYTKTCLRKRCMTFDELIEEGRMIAFEFEDQPNKIEKSPRWKREFVQALDEAGYIRHDILKTRRALRLICAVTGEKFPLYEAEKYDTVIPFDEEQLRDLRMALITLTDRESDVLERHYGLMGYEPMYIERIAAVHKCTRECIRQIEAKAIRKLSGPARRCMLPIVSYK